MARRAGLAVLVLAGDLLRGGATLVEAIGHLALLGFVLATALAMMRRHRLFPALLRIELVLLVVLPTLFWATPETGSYVTEPKLWIAAALRFVATGLFAAAWFIYSLRSVRVRHTFV